MVPSPGDTMKVATNTVVTFIKTDNGVSTCSLNITCSSLTLTV